MRDLRYRQVHIGSVSEEKREKSTLCLHFGRIAYIQISEEEEKTRQIADRGVAGSRPDWERGNVVDRLPKLLN